MNYYFMFTLSKPGFKPGAFGFHATTPIKTTRSENTTLVMKLCSCLACDGVPPLQSFLRSFTPTHGLRIEPSLPIRPSEMARCLSFRCTSRKVFGGAIPSPALACCRVPDVRGPLREAGFPSHHMPRGVLGQIRLPRAEKKFNESLGRTNKCLWRTDAGRC